MTIKNEAMYDEMAASYHLIFEDWQETIERQGKIIARLLTSLQTGPILDCACGIGTQVLGLANLGFSVEGSDISAGEVARARSEAKNRKLSVEIRVDDMRTLVTAPIGKFAAVLAFDNALPHLDSDEDIQSAFAAMQDRLRPGGTVLVGLRNYGPLMLERPTGEPARVFGKNGGRRIVHQVWDWQDRRRYVLHLFITTEERNGEWLTRHFVGRYRAVTPDEVAHLAERAGLREVRVLEPAVTGYYQPIVSATRPSR
jgi:glycine/sarcosine N-methyltransferase